jgi:hypothetical protein
MHSLNNILKTFVKDYGLEGCVVLNSIQNQWGNIAGQTVAAHTFPDTIKGKVLTLIVDTPQWLHHLSFFKEEIATKLKSYNVVEVRFKLGKLPENTKETRAAGDVKLSEDDLRYLENTLKNLKDEDLRETFRTLIVHGLMRGKKGKI